MPAPAYPALSQPWQFTYSGGDSVNILLTAVDANDIKRVLLKIVQIYFGFGTNPWTPNGSSNGSAVVGAGLSNWNSITDMVWANAGTAHSWLRMKQTGIGTTAEILIDLSNTDTRFATIKFAPAGFDTGGTTLNAPTSSGPTSTLCANQLYLSNQTNNTFSLNVMMSNDGGSTRVFLYRSGNCDGAWLFEKFTVLPTLTGGNTIFGGSVPFLGFAVGTGQADPQQYYAPGGAQGGLNGQGSSGTTAHILVGSTDTAVTLMQPDYQTRTVSSRFYYQQESALRGFPIYKYGIGVPSGAGQRGAYGTLKDLWGCTYNVNDRGGFIPIRIGKTVSLTPGGRELVHLRGILTPWNGQTFRMQ